MCPPCLLYIFVRLSVCAVNHPTIQLGVKSSDNNINKFFRCCCKIKLYTDKPNAQFKLMCRFV